MKMEEKKKEIKEEKILVIKLGSRFYGTYSPGIWLMLPVGRNLISETLKKTWFSGIQPL